MLQLQHRLTPGLLDFESRNSPLSSQIPISERLQAFCFFHVFFKTGSEVFDIGCCSFSFDGSGDHVCIRRPNPSNTQHKPGKRDLKTRLIYEDRCDDRLKTKSEESTHLTYTGLRHSYCNTYLETSVSQR